MTRSNKLFNIPATAILHAVGQRSLNQRKCKCINSEFVVSRIVFFSFESHRYACSTPDVRCIILLTRLVARNFFFFN